MNVGELAQPTVTPLGCQALEWGDLPCQAPATRHPRGRLTLVVEEAAVHQDEPALVPLLHPGAGLRDMGGTDRPEGLGAGHGGERAPPPLQGHPLCVAATPLEMAEAGKGR